MFGHKIKSALFAAATASATVVGFGVSPAAADPVILNPQATNGATLQLSATDAAFQATQAGLAFTSDLRINSAVNGGVSGIGVSEVGSFLFTNWGGTTIPQLHGLGINYNIYGTFSFSGTGGWDGNGKFVQTTPITGSVTLYGSAVDTAPGFHQATQEGGPDFGVAIGSGDIVLGTLSVSGFAAGGQPIATFLGFGTNGNGQTLGALLDMIPTPGTTGADGFWQNVLPTGFNLDVTANATSTGTEIDEFANIAQNGPGDDDGCPTAVCSYLRTHAAFTATPASAGSGTVTFDVVTAVPEPATLVLFGAGLLGLGFSLRRRNEANKA